MHKDIVKFVNQLHATSAELKQHVLEDRTLILSRDEVVEFSKLLVSSATVVTEAEKVFVRQEKISYVFAGLAAVGFSLLIPAAYLLFPLIMPSGLQHKRSNVSACEKAADNDLSDVLSWKKLKPSTEMSHSLAAEQVQFAKQAHQVSKALCRQ
jgi:hypothetical protein